MAGHVEPRGEPTGSWRTKQGVAGMSRYLDVYVRAGDEWKAVSAQITRPAKAPT
jgi:hypothetical protein